MHPEAEWRGGSDGPQGPPQEPPRYPPPGAEPPPAAEPAKRRSGPPGCLLGGLAIALILCVALGFGALVSTERLAGDRVRDEVAELAATEVARIDTLPIEPGGTVIVTENDINRELVDYAGDYMGINDPQVDISSDGLELSFSILGVGGSYDADVTVEDGRIVLVDPVASGIAGRVLSAGDMAEITENALNDLTMRSGVAITDVELNEGTMTIFTESTTATPAATLEIATPAAAIDLPGIREETDLSAVATEVIGGTLQGRFAPTTPEATIVRRSQATTPARPTATPPSDSDGGLVVNPVSDSNDPSGSDEDEPTTPANDGIDPGR